MIKTIIKEIIITLLLCIAILFVLGILFYDYNPINIVVPNKIAYSVPENIRNELEEENIQNSITIENKVYTIEGSDLNIYKKKNSYNPSKENPFASTPSEDTNITTSGNVVKTNNTTSKTNTNTIENTTKTNGVNTNTSGEKNTGLK